MRARALGFDGTSVEVPVAEALATAAAGTPVVVAGLLDETGFLEPIREAYLRAVADRAGTVAADRLRAAGLEHLHGECAPDEVAALLVELDLRVRGCTLPMARAIVAAIAPSLGNGYFVSTRTSVRAMVPTPLLEPYPDLRAAGHLQGHLLPVGPHRDPDLTHPHGVVVCWAAVGPVRAGNTIALYPEGDGAPLTPELDPGDVLCFAADGSHGSVPNATGETRVGIGLRVVPGRRLRYGRGVHWRPYADARLLDPPFARFATLQSRATPAAFRRWRWRRAWEREQRRVHGSVPVLTKR